MDCPSGIYAPMVKVLLVAACVNADRVRGTGLVDARESLTLELLPWQAGN